MYKLKLTKVHFLKIFSVSKNLKVFLLLSLSFLAHLSCDTTEPTDDLKPGRRDYIWTVDTLSNVAPSNSYTELWGYDPQHVWLAGDSWDLDKNILEFNGIQWSALPLPSQPPAPAPWALWGTDANNIWAAGDKFFKYVGNNFKYFNKYSLVGFTNLTTLDIFGYTKDNLYAVGGAYEDTTGKYYGYIMKFDGSSWNVIEGPKTKRGTFLKVRIEQTHPNILYILYNQISTNGADYYVILKYSNGQYNEIYNNSANLADIPIVTTLNGEVVFCWDKKVFQLYNNQPKLLCDFSSTSKSTSSLWGRNIKDLFFEVYGGLGHYNGDNIQILYPINKTFYIINCIFFEKEVFILYYEFGNFKFYVLRGKLN